MMKIVESHIIKADTKAILNKYDKDGNLCSLVLEGDRVYKVNASPLSIVEKSTNYYGHSLQGAIEGAKSILGNVSMPPVKISGKLGIYWFPVKSTKHDDHIWISFNHIKDYYPIDKKTLKVIFHDGEDIKIESSLSSFDRKVGRAHMLKNNLEHHTNGEHFYYKKEMKFYQIIRDPARKHYTYVIS